MGAVGGGHRALWASVLGDVMCDVQVLSGRRRAVICSEDSRYGGKDFAGALVSAISTYDVAKLRPVARAYIAKACHY